MISREKKETVIADFRAQLEASQAVLIAENRGLTAAEMAQFRRDVRNGGGHVQVVKNTLAKIAMSDGVYQPLAEHLSGPLIFGASPDPAGLAKVFADTAKGNDKLNIRGGALAEGVLLDAAGVGKLASIPPREQLLAMLMSAMQAPTASFLRTLQAVPAGVVRALAAVRDKKQSEDK